MKTFIRWATIALAAAGLSVVAPLTASAQYDYNAPNSDNCSNIRTLTTDRCVHYSERAKNQYADQEANRLATKYGTGVGVNGAYVNPFGQGRDAPSKDQIENEQGGHAVDIWYTRQDGSIGQTSVFMTPDQIARYYASRDALHSVAVQGGAYGHRGGTGGTRSGR
jgi:hypothetical protein